MPTDTAIVQGSARRAVAYFIEDSNGDLVDIEYACIIHGIPNGALPWPAYGENFGDSDVHCREKDCRALINQTREHYVTGDPNYQSRSAQIIRAGVYDAIARGAEPIEEKRSE